MRRQLQDARVVVTGASSGIGQALATLLARRGARVIVTARRSNRLQTLVSAISESGGTALAVAGDITEGQTRHDILAAAESQWGGLDVLVNNAGVGALGPFALASPERLRQVMEVNFFAPAELMRGSLPLLRAGRQPLIVNVSSVLGHRAVPNKSEYCASKFALHGLSDAVRAELASSGIDVLLVSPSTTDSEFFENVLERQPVKSAPGRAMSTDWVARRIVRAMELGRHEMILTLPGKALVWLDRLFPTLADRLIARWG